MDELRKELIKHARAYNSVLTIEYLEKQQTIELIKFAHPTERDEYETRLNKLLL